MIKDLQCHEELYTDNISSSEDELFYKPCKRHRVDCTLDKRTVYTGKECLTNLG